MKIPYETIMFSRKELMEGSIPDKTERKIVINFIVTYEKQNNNKNTLLNS